MVHVVCKVRDIEQIVVCILFRFDTITSNCWFLNQNVDDAHKFMMTLRNIIILKKKKEKENIMVFSVADWDTWDDGFVF